MTVCKHLPSGNVEVEHYYNPGRTRPVLYSNSSPAIGFSDIKASYSNGILQCSFNRTIKMNQTKNYFDLTKPYYLLTASGSVENSKFY